MCEVRLLFVVHLLNRRHERREKLRERRTKRQQKGLWPTILRPLSCLENVASVRRDPNEHVTKEDVRCAILRIAKRAGLEHKISAWHIGRHTFATHAAMLRVNPWELMVWLGHRRLEETQLYADTARAHQRQIPRSVREAGAEEIDPEARVLIQLSARLSLLPQAVDKPVGKSGSKMAALGPNPEIVPNFPGRYAVTPPGLEPGISA